MICDRIKIGKNKSIICGDGVCFLNHYVCCGVCTLCEEHNCGHANDIRKLSKKEIKQALTFRKLNGE
jgi:hypothetical protein